MDDKQLATQPAWMAWIRPALKAMVRQRWLSSALFRNAARPAVIRRVLNQAYPSGHNIDADLVDLLFQPTQRDGAAEAFRGFINLFDDYLAPDLMRELPVPVDLIWGENDPWEPSRRPSVGPKPFPASDPYPSLRMQVIAPTMNNRTTLINTFWTQ